MLDIGEIAQGLNIPEEHIELHGKFTAKVTIVSEGLVNFCCPSSQSFPTLVSLT